MPAWRAGAVRSERIVSAAVRRTRPDQYFVKDRVRGCPEDVLATYFVDARVSERRESVGCLGRGAALWHPGVACPKKGGPVEL